MRFIYSLWFNKLIYCSMIIIDEKEKHMSM
jgi:hypothetical protein